MGPYYLVLLILYDATAFVSSTDMSIGKGCNDSPSPIMEFSPLGPPSCRECRCPPDSAVYVLAGTVGVLFFIIIGLLIVLYKLQKRKGGEDTEKIVQNNTLTKYCLQNDLSSDSTNTNHQNTFTRQLSNDDPRNKFKRQESKMSVVHYPDHLDNPLNKKNLDEPQSSTSTIRKNIYKQPEQHIEREKMNEIIKAVLAKSKEKNETSSLSNLENILNEGNETNSLQVKLVEKSASSSILDSEMKYQSPPSPISVKKVINNFEASLTPKPLRKINNTLENKQHVNIIEDNAEKENKRCLLFALPDLTQAKSTDALIVDDIYDNPPTDRRPVNISKSAIDQLDSVYIDTPSNRPVSLTNELYDNPPNNRPIDNNKDVPCDEIYDDFPNRIRPVSDSIYDDVRSDQPASNPNLLNTEYVVPPKTDDHDTHFKLDYVNARSPKL